VPRGGNDVSFSRRFETNERDFDKSEVLSHATFVAKLAFCRCRVFLCQIRLVRFSSASC